MSTSFSGLRIALIVFFSLLFLAGASLTGVSVTRNQNYNVLTNSSICQQSFSAKLIPYQIEPFTCTMTKNSWLTLTLLSSTNVTVVALLNSSASITTILNQTSTSFSVTFPAFTTGVLTMNIMNIQDAFVTVEGGASVNIAKPTVVTLPFTYKPFSTIGYGTIGVSGVFLFMLIWNPNRLTTRFLDRFHWNKQNGSHSTTDQGIEDSDDGNPA